MFTHALNIAISLLLASNVSSLPAASPNPSQDGETLLSQQTESTAEPSQKSSGSTKTSQKASGTSKSTQKGDTKSKTAPQKAAAPKSNDWPETAPVLSKDIVKEPFTWKRLIGVGSTIDLTKRTDATFKSYGGNVSSENTVTHFRFKIEKEEPRADQFSSDKWLLLVWMAAKNMPAELKKEPATLWVMSELSAAGIFALAGGERSFGGIFPYWRVCQEGTYEVDKTVRISVPEGVTDTINYNLTYVGTQTVGGIQSGRFEYTSSQNTLGGSPRPGKAGTIWINKGTGLYSLVEEKYEGVMNNQKTGVSGTGSYIVRLWTVR